MDESLTGLRHAPTELALFPELFLKSSFHRAARFERICGYRGSSATVEMEDPGCGPEGSQAPFAAAGLQPPRRVRCEIFPAGKRPAGECDCTGQLANVGVLRSIPVTKGLVHRILPEDVAKIQSYNLDVILRFGFNILKADHYGRRQQGEH